MARLQQIGIFGVSAAVLAAVFILSPKPQFAASQAMGSMPVLPERPPTFDEIFALAEKNQAEFSLVESYFNSQTSTEGAEKFIALADQGNMTAAAMACYILETGLGGITDKDKSAAYCQTAAKAGKTVSAANLLYRNFKANPTTENWDVTYDAFTVMMKSDPARGHLGLQFLYRQNHPKASGKLVRHHLKKAIEYGDPFAMQALAQLDLNGRLEYRNLPRAERNYKKAYDLYNFDAGVDLAIRYRDGIVFEQDLETYQTMIKRMAAFLHPKSMSALAEMYELGEGVEIDTEKARALHIQAADLGSKSSQRMLAYDLLRAPDAKDRAKGVRYLEADANKGDVNSMMGLSNYYARKDIADPKNLRVRWLVAAAINGDETAPETLGFGYMETGYIKEMLPYIQALEYAASVGNPEASFLLARHYRAASGVKRDLRKAKRILERVESQKHPRCLEEQEIIKGYIEHFGSIDAVPDIIQL